MSNGKKGFQLFWHIMLTGMFLIILFRNVEPLKTVNEMYPAPSYLLLLAFFTSGTVWFIIAFRNGKVIRKEADMRRKDRESP
jgi:hypothetical protein